MADSRLAHAVKYKYDVFISYKSDYDELLARQIEKALSRKNLNVIAGWHHEAFPAGQPTIACIERCVEQSGRTLVILTKKSIQSNWVLLELLQALDQSKKSNILTLRLLLHDVQQNDINFLKCGMLAEVPHYTLDFNLNSWPDELIEFIRSEVPLSSVLSVGSGLAHGLVFSHYVGFLSHVLPVLADEIKKSEIYKNKPDYVSMKYYLLLPGSCKILDDLSIDDPETGICIEKSECIKFEKMHAGKPRKFNIQIYKITKHKNTNHSETYYFIADCPHVLKAICQLDELNKADRRFQLARFYYILNVVLNHVENEGCNDIVRLILYNEQAGESIQSVLFEWLKDDIPKQVLEKYSRTDDWTPPIQRLMSKPDGDCEYDVTISFLRDEKKDREVGWQIKTFLDQKKMKVYAQEDGDRSVFHLPAAKWHIFVLSKKTINTDNYVKTLCFGILYQNMDDNLLKVLPVVVGIEPEVIPRIIKCVTVVKAQEPKYCEQLLTTMKGENIRLEQAMPAGYVAPGLAWAYVINYLKITLMKESRDGLDLVGRIKQCLKEKGVTCGCIKKMFVIVSKSCDMDSDLVEKANEKSKSIEGGRYTVEKVDKMLPVYENTGGQLERPFYLHMFQYTDRNTLESKCFIAEYSTPHKCIREMAYSYSFAGLKPDDMKEQGKEIVELIPQILSNEYVKKKYGDMTKLVEFVYYDDDKESLGEALGRHLQNQSEMVYV